MRTKLKALGMEQVGAAVLDHPPNGVKTTLWLEEPRSIPKPDSLHRLPLLDPRYIGLSPKPRIQAEDCYRKAVDSGNGPTRRRGRDARFPSLKRLLDH